MEELRNENNEEPMIAEEPLVEQRPSTKYGRTAYQQQLEEQERFKKEQKASETDSVEKFEEKNDSFNKEKLYCYQDWKN